MRLVWIQESHGFRSHIDDFVHLCSILCTQHHRSGSWSMSLRYSLGHFPDPGYCLRLWSLPNGPSWLLDNICQHLLGEVLHSICPFKSLTAIRSSARSSPRVFSRVCSPTKPSGPIASPSPSNGSSPFPLWSAFCSPQSHRGGSFDTTASTLWTRSAASNARPKARRQSLPRSLWCVWPTSKRRPCKRVVITRTASRASTSGEQNVPAWHELWPSL